MISIVFNKKFKLKGADVFEVNISLQDLDTLKVKNQKTKKSKLDKNQREGEFYGK